MPYAHSNLAALKVKSIPVKNPCTMPDCKTGYSIAVYPIIISILSVTYSTLVGVIYEIPQTKPFKNVRFYIQGNRHQDGSI